MALNLGIPAFLEPVSNQWRLTGRDGEGKAGAGSWTEKPSILYFLYQHELLLYSVFIARFLFPDDVKPGGLGLLPPLEAKAEQTNVLCEGSCTEVRRLERRGVGTWSRNLKDSLRNLSGFKRSTGQEEWTGLFWIFPRDMFFMEPEHKDCHIFGDSWYISWRVQEDYASF